MTEEYVLCSSSTEEVEIQQTRRFESVPNTIFPRNISILRDWYHPQTQLFIGHNSIPSLKNYPDVVGQKKLTSRLRRDIPFVFNLISFNKDKSFFRNKFEMLSEVNLIENKLKITDFELMKTYDEQVKEIKNLEHISSLAKNQYSGMYEIFSFDDRRHEVAPNISEYPNCNKFILTRDSIVDRLDNPNVFVFFRVIKSRKGISYVFEDSYFRKLQLYEYLDLYFDEVMRSKNSFEIKTYVCKDTFLAVFSSSIFKIDNSTFRYYDGLDVDKNFISVINLDTIDIKPLKMQRKNNFDFILNLNLEEGDYAINDWKIFKMGLNGDKHEYEGLVFDDVNFNCS